MRRPFEKLSLTQKCRFNTIFDSVEYGKEWPFYRFNPKAADERSFILSRRLSDQIKKVSLIQKGSLDLKIVTLINSV